MISTDLYLSLDSDTTYEIRTSPDTPPRLTIDLDLWVHTRQTLTADEAIAAADRFARQAQYFAAAVRIHHRPVQPSAEDEAFDINAQWRPQP